MSSENLIKLDYFVKFKQLYRNYCITLFFLMLSLIQSSPKLIIHEIVKTVKNINSYKPFALYPANCNVICIKVPSKSEIRNIDGTFFINLFINITSLHFAIILSCILK